MYILLIVAAVITTVGFYRFVYFLSSGYAFAVVGLAVALMIGFSGSLTGPVFILLALIALYAARLGFFIVIRELKSGSAILTDAACPSAVLRQEMQSGGSKKIKNV